MATAPFGAVLETALKESEQGGKLTMMKDIVVTPQFFCCLSGSSIGLNKDPVPVLVVTPTSQCTNADVVAEAGLSWSPTATLDLWEIDWGDGNTDNGNFAGATSATHQYTDPGTFTVTLTVTDNVGATASTEVEVQISECFPVIEFMAGCGASGIWATYNCGNTWDDRSGGILSGVRIYDLKVNPATVMSASYTQAAVEVWAATEKGLYRSVNRGHNWKRLTLPIADGLVPDIPLSIAPSTVDRDEWFVLVEYVGGKVYLCHTLDSGQTWQTPVEITYYERPAGAGNIESLVWGGYGLKKFATLSQALYVYTDQNVAVRDNPTQTWAAIAGGGVGTNISSMLALDELWVSIVWAVGALPPTPTLGRWIGGTWTLYDSTATGGMRNSLTLLSSGYLASCFNTTIPAATGVRVSNLAGTTVTDYAFTAGNWTGGGIVEYEGTLFAVVTVPAAPDQCAVYRYEGGVWIMEPPTIAEGVTIQGHLTEFPDGLYDVATADGVYKRNDVTQRWEQVSVWDACSLYRDDDGALYFGGRYGGVYRYDPYLKATVFVAWAATTPAEVLKIWISGLTKYDDSILLSVWYDSGGANQDRIYRIDEATPLVPTVTGLSLDTDAGGNYVYIALLDATSRPIVLRYDSTHEFLDVVYAPGTGTWGGVVCDKDVVGRVWLFGDFGTGRKVFVSDDFGVSLTNVTDAGWAADELVRPLLPSRIYPGSAIAILNTALETWETLESGDVWYQVGTNNTAFGAQCGVRGGLYDDLIFIGRVDAGANHLQFSFCAGYNWEERSTGITALAPISAIQMLDEENEV